METLILAHDEIIAASTFVVAISMMAETLPDEDGAPIMAVAGEAKDRLAKAMRLIEEQIGKR